jgi:hypothetical protein
MQRRATCRRAVAIGLFLALCLALCHAHAFAGGGPPFTLPRNPGTSSVGLFLTVNSEWVHGYGHRPVELTLASAVPASEDRHFRIEVGIGGYGGFSGSRCVVETDLDLPAGSQSASKSVPVLQMDASALIWIRTFEGGREIEELSVERYAFATNQVWGGEPAVPRILFVADNPPDVTSFDFLGSEPYMSYSQGLTFTQLKDVFAFTHWPPNRLYDQWLYYSGLDLMFISLAEVRQLAAQQPAAWRAIADWNRTGGTLCLFDTGRDPATLQEIEKLLGAPEDETLAAKPNRGWKAPTSNTFDEQVRKSIEAAAAAAARSGNGSATAPSTPLPTAPSEPPFFWRDIAFGQVVSIPADDPFPGERDNWKWLLASLEASSSRWASRNGTIPDGSNPQFNDLLIADVGLPPIRSYRVLITLFVVLIGPVNYWLLRRSGRLHLFLFTVPLAALVTSLGLLGYAVIADGFTSHLRGRSLTLLDQRTSQATTRSWLSYYVGLTPPGGLSFTQDTLVVPLQMTPTIGEGRNRHIDWNGQQQLSRGWLPARTPTQLVTARASTSEIGLDVSAAEGGSRRIQNRLGVRIHHLALRDENGGWHQAHDVAAGEQAALELLPDEEQRAVALESFGKVLKVNAPSLPPGMDISESENWFLFGNRYRAMSYAYGMNSVDPRDNRLEHEFSRLRIEVVQQTLPKRTYVAIVDRPATVNAGLDGLIESQGMHVIQGTW